MTRPLLEVADIFRVHGNDFIKAFAGALSSARKHVLYAIVFCRTAVFGGHIDYCNRDECDYEDISYNSCCNRHCPKCQGAKRAKWLEARQADLLPVEYFHVVFTVPTEIADIAMQNKKVLYNILFRASAATLTKIAEDPKHLGAKIGFLSMLHTWGQTMLHHPHIHCVVPGGGLSLDGSRWVACRPGFFLPVRILSSVFRGRFLDMTRRAFAKGELSFQGKLEHLNDSGHFNAHLNRACKDDWVVYSKPPFGGPEQALKYLARYIHRTAISNHRLISLQNGKVCFRYKDYAHNNRQKSMTLDVFEFMRRFLLHVLPKGFMGIRQYGLLANACRAKNLALCRSLLGCASEPIEDNEDRSLDESSDPTDDDSIPICPKCKEGRLITKRLPRQRRKLWPSLFTDQFAPQAIDSS